MCCRPASDFALVTYEALEDAAMSSNVRYREMFFNPTLHPGLSYTSMLAGITDGIRAAEHDYGITARLIPSIYRQDPVSTAMEMVEAVVARPDDHVVGIGMDGDELADPPERFAAVYALAGKAGLHRGAHVAHDGPASFIETCLDVLGCERIDHGYHVVDDPVLMARLRDSGTAFLCATPTPRLCGWPSAFDESPVKRMIDAGLTVTLNSDDPPMLHTDLGTEFQKVCNGWGLGAARAKQFVMDAIDAAWCDASERAALGTHDRPRARPDARVDTDGGRCVPDSIPVVDIAATVAAGRPVGDVCDQVDRACRIVGFFAITGHGIPDAMRADVLAEAHRFFAMPEADKRRLGVEHSGNHRGYAGVAGERLQPDLPPDLKETFDVGPEVAPDDPLCSPLDGLSQWPDLPGFRETIEGYQARALDIAVLLMRVDRRGERAAVRPLRRLPRAAGGHHPPPALPGGERAHRSEPARLRRAQRLRVPDAALLRRHARPPDHEPRR